MVSQYFTNVSITKDLLFRCTIKFIDLEFAFSISVIVRVIVKPCLKTLSARSSHFIFYLNSLNSLYFFYVYHAYQANAQAIDY